ncbi:MAG: ribonuclease E/G [Defluviitaleaceae bacterium]|nr:ribonuclease E/G [Defluviitaleaceae bacterium]MCL2274247.1 ribonuclease E/G [Defluviitaleaceae bacterium]
MKRLFIAQNEHALRTAYTVDDKLTEVYVDPTGTASRVGHVYVARVKNILPGRFAFVDIGDAKNAFINLPNCHGLKKGDAITMQVYKDAYAEKGAYGGLQLKIKGRFVIVHESERGEIGVSHKITDAQERSRLRSAVHGVLKERKGFGAVVRTNALGQAEEAVENEARDLIARYFAIQQRAKYVQPPALLHPENDAHEALLTDLLTDDLDEIWLACPLKIQEAIIQILPSLKSKIHLYEGEVGLFDAYNITCQMERALEKTVYLPCGGHLTIEQTEACVVIDVNTGAFSGAENYSAAILRTNIEAAAVIAAQLTLRNLSGIIIIDFIDMKDRSHKQKLLDALAAEIKKDRIKTELVSMTELGLVQLTRRKTRPPLAHEHIPKAQNN